MLLLMMIIGGLVVSVGSAGAAQGTPVATPAAPSGGLTAAVQWLLTQQADDGGFVGFEGVSDPGVTCDAVIAMIAARQSGIDGRLDQPLSRAFGFIQEQGAAYAATGAGQASKLALAAIAAGVGPTAVGGVDLLALIEGGINEETGIYGTGVFDHALAMLALTGAGRDVPGSAIEALQETESDQNGWAFDGNPEPAAVDSNTTAVVIQALVAAGFADSDLVVDGLAFLHTAQTENGSFRFQTSEGFPPDANSTALAVQALIAAGEDPASDTWNNAGAALAAFQNQSGAFRYAEDQPDDNLFSTLQAIPVLAELALPIVPANVPSATPVATPAA